MIEVNFDGLVGPTHNYGGLSYGNTASLNFAQQISSPKRAALQGLHKARVLADHGLVQGILPPHLRPNVEALRNIGFHGSDQEVISQAYHQHPRLLFSVSSSSFMWTANAVSVCPSSDSTDGRVHFTPANLRTKPHRAIETSQTQHIFKNIFSDESIFVVHDPIRMGNTFCDEGAANHTRFEFHNQGYHFFVYGCKAFHNQENIPKIFPARQTLEASQAVARINCIHPEKCFFVQQNPKAIDAGVFHNDVISVGHQNILLYHEMAFLETEKVIAQLDEMSKGSLIKIKVLNDQVNLQKAVKTYLFNSQIVTMPKGYMALIAPQHCKEDKSVNAFIHKMLNDHNNPIDEVIYFDLLQSMKNGGGPACLRLRVPLTQKQLEKINQGCLLSNAKYEELVKWVHRHYRDELKLQDLADFKLFEESQEALRELEEIMNIQLGYH